MMNKNVDTIGYLTPLQHGMLHHSQREPASGIYVEQFSCVLEGPLDLQRFERAWQSVVQRHDVLKTLFIRLREEKPMQVVRRQVTLPFVLEDWRGAADPEGRFEALLAQDRARGFDPSVAPLMRIRLIELGGGRHRFLWTYHHAILDGWSMPVLLEEVFRLYAGAPTLPPPANDYRRYVAWLRKQDMGAVRAFWSAQLAGFRKPLRFAPSMAPQDREPSARRLVTVAGAMAEGWSEAALSWCRASRITLNTLCQGAWSALLALYGDSDDIVHGMVVSGRSPEVASIETMVGLFINTLPVRVQLDATQDLVEWLRHLQSQTHEIERHAHSPLAEVLQCAQLPRTQPLFESIYVFENYPGQAAFRDMVAGVGLKVDALRAVEATNYPLALIVLPAKGLDFHLTFDTARFTEAAMVRLLAQYRALLERIVAGEVERVQDLHLDGAEQDVSKERHEASDESLLERVARHAALHPQQAACVGRAWRLDYRELADHAALALRQWEAWGYQSGDRVLLCCHDDAAGLALLLAGLAHGIDCVLPDADADLPALLAAGPVAWGAEGVRACVWTGAGSIEMPGLRCDVFDPADAGRLTAPGLGAHQPARGACSLVRQGEDGEWTLLRHDHSQLLQAAEWFAEACPVAEARDVALAQAPLSHATIWTTLLGLGCGLSMRQVGGDDDFDLLCAAVAGDVHWHSVRLGPVASRQLGTTAQAPSWRVDHCLVDACAVTAEGLRRLHAQAAEAQVLCELRWPAHSLPHAAHAGGDAQSVLGAPRAGASIDIVDRHWHAAATDARGRLVIRGATVPTCLLRGGVTDRAAWQWGQDGPRLITDLAAWRTEDGCRAELPRVLAGATCPAEVPLRATHVAPRDETESAVHEIWCELLERERIGVDDDFFDLGGQSLLASVMLYRIEEKLAVALGMDTLLDSPTVAGLARAIREGGATGGARCDLEKEAVLAADIVPAAPYRPGPAQDIFLTGATGFLGVHLLAELLETTRARVHCLVRADSEASGLQRLAGALESHGLWRQELAARIVAVPGELDKPLLGLGAARFDALAREVDVVYHNGAAVNFVYPYRSLKQVNVLATEDVLRLACLHKTKPVHYISTVGVLDRTADVLEESLLVPLHDKLLGGYEQSKWVAERLVGMASQRGLPVATYRPSRIVGHSRTGRMNTDDLFSRLIKGIAMQGEAPRDLGFDNMLPVDLASRLIVACSLNPGVHGHAVHVVNPQSNPLDAVVDAIEAQGHPIERLDYDRWLERLAAHAKRDPGHPLASLVPVLRKLNPAADPSLRRRMPFAHENIARWAGPVLAQGLRPVDEWLRAYFDHFDAIGFLARPAQSLAQQLAA